jgi:hypothetical protein
MPHGGVTNHCDRSHSVSWKYSWDMPTEFHTKKGEAKIAKKKRRKKITKHDSEKLHAADMVYYSINVRELEIQFSPLNTFKYNSNFFLKLKINSIT